MDFQSQALEEIVSAVHRLLHTGFPDFREISEMQARWVNPQGAEEEARKDLVKEIQDSVYYALKRENVIEHLGFHMVYKPVNYHREKDNSYGMMFTSNTNFWPTNVQVEKVPQYVLGEGVLGRAFTGLGVIQIDERLHGEAFYEVLTHEMEHMMYPHLSEGEIRLRTRYKLPHKPLFH